MQGFYYICEALYVAVKAGMAFYLISNVAPPKHPVWIERVVQGISIIVVAGFDVFNISMIKYVFSNNLLWVCILFISLIAKYLYKGQWKDGFYITFLFWVIVSIGDFFLQTLLYVGLKYIGSEPGIFIRVSTVRGIYLLLLTVAAMVVGMAAARWLKKGFRYFQRLRRVCLIAVILSGISVIYFQRVYNQLISEPYIRHWGLFIIALLMMLLFFLLLYIKTKAEEEKRIWQLKAQMLDSKYQELLEVYKEKASFLHDVNKHLRVIGQIAEQQNALGITEYLGELNIDLQKGEQRLWTGHGILDLILNMKEQEAGEEHIDVRIFCDSMPSMEIKSSGLCTLFVNAIDNAIEANKEIADVGERWISISCKKCSHMLMVSISNPTAAKVEVNENALSTVEEDNSTHGFGIENIKRVLEVYDGYMEIECQEGIFNLVMMLSVF